MECPHCSGIGLRLIRTEYEPCACALRAIFAACHERFVQCATRDKGVSAVKLERSSGPQSHMMFGRKTEEYLADFIGVSRRTLGEGTFEWRVFKAHFLLGAHPNLIARRFNTDAPTIWRHIYSIRVRLGRAFRETEPYGLYPLDEYFSGAVRGKVATPCHVPTVQKRTPVRAPLAHGDYPEAA